MQGLPSIKITVREIDTHGVVRLKTGGMEYILVTRVCKGLGMTPKELFKRIVVAEQGLPLLETN